MERPLKAESPGSIPDDATNNPKKNVAGQHRSLHSAYGSCRRGCGDSVRLPQVPRISCEAWWRCRTSGCRIGQRPGNSGSRVCVPGLISRAKPLKIRSSGRLALDGPIRTPNSTKKYGHAGTVSDLPHSGSSLKPPSRVLVALLAPCTYLLYA
jgi:hypothetical protein